MGASKVVRNSFIAGFAILAPLAVTGIVLQWSFARLTGLLDPIVVGTRLTQYTANDHLAAQLLAAGYSLAPSRSWASSPPGAWASGRSPASMH
jgi:uncharacterized membrane protein